jgi:hypothetical protein
MQLPQGMAYGWWRFPVPFVRDLSFRIQIDGNINRLPGRYLQLYQGTIAGVDFYFGFQTDVFRPGLGDQGHGLIFSRWGTRSSSDARVVQNGWIENAGHEGDFVGVRAAYVWSRSEYLCKLAPVEKDELGFWYEFKVENVGTNEKVSAGCLRFPSSEIESGGGSWTEVYSGVSSEDEVPITEMRILQISGNDGAVYPDLCETTYNKQFTSADASVENGSLILRSGIGIKRSHEPKKYVINRPKLRN